MNDPIIAFVIAASLILGTTLGFMWGTHDSRVAIAECQKELPRNVTCTMIAVPVDKN